MMYSSFDSSQAPRLGPAQQPLEPAPNILLSALFSVFICFHFPAFTYQLAMDVTGRWTGSIVLQTATVTSELFAIMMILASPAARRVLVRSWPIWGAFALAFLSTTWSLNPRGTLQAANTSMTTALLGLAVGAWFPGFQAVRFMIRVMALGCALSIVWVVLFPDQAVHQATDAFQTVHAGLWRGIFSHKQGLGYFAGVTTGLLFFYNTKIFSPIVLVGALACSLACLVGTQSATGAVAAVLSLLLLSIAYIITRYDPSVRRSMLAGCIVVALVIAALYQSGLLDFFTVQILGKSTDLTGRTFFWQVVMTAFNNSNLTLLGGGYSAGVSGYFMDNSVDNGYIEKILEFGYFGSPFIFGLYIVILWWCMTLVVRARRDQAMLNVFPIGIVATIAIANITESNFMTKSFGTILLSIAVAVIVHQRSRQPVRASAPDPRPFGTARPGPGRERGMPGHSVGR